MSNAPAPSSRTTLPTGDSLTDEQLAEMVWKEASGAGRIIGRLRVLIPIAILLVVLWLVAFEPNRWRMWVVVATSAVIMPLFVRDLFWLKKVELTPRHMPYLLAPVVAMQTAVIAVTGGADSPFLVLYVVIGIAPAMTIGRLKPSLAMAMMPLALLWLFTLGATTGELPNLLPNIFGGAAAAEAHNDAYRYTQAVVFTTATFIGGGVVLGIRAAVERTARTATTMRSELLSSMRERNRELLGLSGELAHELKNPLASILGLATILERKLEPDSKEHEHMRVLLGEAKRMGATLDEFLNFSRPVTGLSARPVKPEELMAGVAQLHEGLALQRGLTLSISAEPAAAISCDPRKVKQVLVNLMQNALEATPRGGHIEAVTKPERDGGAQFIVRDDGPGIAAEVRGRLFEPGITAKSGGSGLGLTIARAIAEQHGGSLTLETPAEGGCLAVLALPAEPARAPDAGEGS